MQKNWDALVQTDFLCDFSYNSTTFKQYTFEHDFVMDFVFNVTRFSAHKDYVKCPLNMNFYSDDVMKNVLSHVRDLNIQITTDDWKVIIKSVAALYTSSKIDRSTCEFVMRITVCLTLLLMQ